VNVAHDCLLVEDMECEANEELQRQQWWAQQDEDEQWIERQINEQERREWD
jgi:hypothetical protein